MSGDYGNQDVLNPTVLEFVHHRLPEFGRFVVSDPQPRNLSQAVPVDAGGHMDSLVPDHAAVHWPTGECPAFTERQHRGF